ncbi:MAG: SLC13 family permease, partial [Methanocellales archaeon]|nr:SLC13 family permease [Methanocellales archaeon]
MMISIIILAVVFMLIAIRQVGNIKLKIWQIMLFGAIAVLITGQISPTDALKSINVDVMVFLFSMFVIGVALEESGYLSHLSYEIFKRAKNLNQMLLLILFGMGFASALLMNDTLAIIGTPMVLLLAKKHDINPKALLIVLAFAITIGSVMSPIGNPQNFLIATQGNINNPFLTFLRYLLVPTIINLFAAFLLIKIVYKGQFNNNSLNHSQEPIKDPKLAILSKLSLVLLLILIFIKIAIAFLNIQIDLKLVYITLI